MVPIELTLNTVIASVAKQSSEIRGRLNSYDFGSENDKKTRETLSAEWQEASEKEQKNRTIFAQWSLKPEQVLPEWQKQTAALGDRRNVSRFVQDTLQIAGSPLSPLRNTAYKLNIDPLPEVLRERIKEAGWEKPFRLDFEYPPEKQGEFLHRSHPVVSLLADYVLESALETNGETPNINLAACCGVYEMGAVYIVTIICLLWVMF